MRTGCEASDSVINGGAAVKLGGWHAEVQTVEPRAEHVSGAHDNGYSTPECTWQDEIVSTLHMAQQPKTTKNINERRSRRQVRSVATCVLVCASEKYLADSIGRQDTVQNTM